MAVDGIDHVHVEVADRDRAARWYERVLGLTRVPRVAHWAEHPQGPLFLATPGGTSALALFQGADRPHSRNATIAFRMTGAAFLAFMDRLDDLALPDPRTGALLTRADIVDHDLCWSLYFLDPDGNTFELTTYDYAAVGEALKDTTPA